MAGFYIGNGIDDPNITSRCKETKDVSSCLLMGSIEEVKAEEELWWEGHTGFRSPAQSSTERFGAVECMPSVSSLESKFEALSASW